MRWVTGLLVWGMLAAPAFAGEYVVLSGVDSSDPYHEAAKLLAEHHKTKHVLRFDPEKPEEALPALRRIQPQHVAIVVKPEQIHVNSVRAILRMATKVDEDPFVDFAHGFITAETSEEAVQFVRLIIEAAKAKQPRKVGSAAVWGGKGACRAWDDEYIVGTLRLPQRSLRFVAPAGKDRDQSFIDAETKSLAGCGAIIMGGHGMPWEIGHGPRAEDIGKLSLFPAVAFNYACHTGVTTRYPEREWKGGTVVERFIAVEKKKSFALNMIRSGVTGYVAYVNPRPAGPELSTDFARVVAGASMGESRRADYAKILLGYLGFGEKGIVPPTWEEGRARKRSEVDAVRHMMLDGATGGILYGDPAFRPYPVTEGALPLEIRAKRVGENLHVHFRMAARGQGIWCADPFRRYPNGSVGMARKVYGRVELPKDAPEVRTVWIETARHGAKAIDTLNPVWAVETDQGKRYLHLKANFDYGTSGDLEVSFVASADEKVPEHIRKREEERMKPKPPPDPKSLDLAGLAEAANARALDRRNDLSAWLAELGRRPRPDAFDVVLHLIKTGKGHWRTYLLLDATKSKGDEKKLMDLADGPPLPRYGRWTALSSLGGFDTKEVREYLLSRVARGDDAGLFMSAAQALGRLGEKDAHKPVSSQLLAFEKGWSGVQSHLLGALYQIGHEKLAETLEAYATDERAVTEFLVGGVLGQLHNRDPSAAKRAAKKVVASKRFEGFSAEWQAQIRRIAESK